MKCIEIREYGSAEKLSVRSREDNLMPGDRQVLVEVKAASYNPVDTAIRTGMFDPVSARSFPQSQGQDWAGIISAVGSEVTEWKVGDEVYGCQPAADIHDDGSWAELMRVDLEHLARKPRNITWEEAAGLPLAGLTSLQSLRDKGGLAPGKGMRVFINGASGGVGHTGVQLAKILGAEYVCGTASPKNHDIVRGLGADQVWDYRTFDPAECDQKFDIFFDAAAKLEYTDISHLLTEHGVYIRTRPTAKTVAAAAVTKAAGLVGFEKKAKVIWMEPNSADLAALSEFVESGKLRVIIAQSFPFESFRQFVEAGEAHEQPGKYILKI